MIKRVQYIDIAKGIGILLVVMGHNDMNFYHPLLHRFIYAFHMALFFFLSGVFFKTERKFSEIFKRRFNSLIKPLIFIILLIYGISVFFGKMSFSTAGGRLLKSLYMTGPYLNWVQLWFLPTLFLVNLYAYFFYKFTNPIQKDWIRWIVLLITLRIGLLPLPYTWPLEVEVLGKSLTLHGAPANVDLVLLAGFFFILGREIYRQLPEGFFASKLTLLLSGGLLLGMVFTLDIPVDFNTRLYTSFVLNTIEAIAGIIFTLALSRQIELYFSKLGNLLNYIGSMTLSIFIFHVPIQEMVNGKLVPYIGQNDLTILLAFLAGVLIPIFIHLVFIAPNPVVGAWFGIQPSPKAKSPKV